MVLGRITTPRVKIGVFGIGLHAYWDQFPGLKERLEGFQRHVEQRLRSLGADVISAGLVDTAMDRKREIKMWFRVYRGIVLCRPLNLDRVV